MKQVIKKELKFIGRKALGAFVFVAVAGTSIWALAAFTEPTAGPSSSVQDFAKNIMGANSSDNDFDSSSVTANSDGSVIERLESLEAQVGATALSAEAGSNMTVGPAATYCRNLSATAEYAINESETSTTYTDWRLGTIEELTNFIGMTTSTHVVWTATASGTNYNNGNLWRGVRMSDGYLYNFLYNASTSVICVR